MSTLKIIATILIKEEFKEDLESIFHKVIDETHKESGCVAYNLHQDLKNPLKYIILEEWKNQEAIDLHNESSHFKEFAASIDGKIENLSIDVIREIY